MRNRLVLFGNFVTFKKYSEKHETSLWGILLNNFSNVGVVIRIGHLLENEMKTGAVAEADDIEIKDVTNVLGMLGLDRFYIKGDHGKKRTMWIILTALDDREKADGDFVKKNRESFLNGLKRGRAIRVVNFVLRR